MIMMAYTSCEGKKKRTMYPSGRGHGPRHEDDDDVNNLQPMPPKRLLAVDTDKSAVRDHSMHEAKPATKKSLHQEKSLAHQGSRTNHHHSRKSTTATASQQVSPNDTPPRRESTGLSNTATMAPPPGTPEGGVWGSVKYEGIRTGCIKLFMCLIFWNYYGLIKLCIRCCPCDKKDAYMVERDVRRTSDNKVYKSRTFYDTDGEMIAMKLYDVDTNEKVESHGNAKKFKPFGEENSTTMKVSTSTTCTSDLADDGMEVVSPTKSSSQGPVEDEAEALASDEGAC